MKDFRDFGPIELAVLAVVATKPLHGYAIIELLKIRSRQVFDLPEGTVYPTLYRLEQEGCLRSHTMTVGGRSRRVYELTSKGRSSLRQRRQYWQRLNIGIQSVLHGVAHGQP